MAGKSVAKRNGAKKSGAGKNEVGKGAVGKGGAGESAGKTTTRKAVAKKEVVAKKAVKGAVLERAMPRKGGLWVALVTFLVTATLGVVINSFVFGRGLSFDRSISRYVGYETWSAVVFALGNGLVVAMVASYLWRLGEAWKMPRVYYYCAFLMAVGLIWLSACPVGYCDIGGRKSVVSLFHELTSKTMFIMMMLVAAMLAGNRRASAGTRAVCVAYVVYGIFCVTGYLTEGSWFEPLVLVYESTYIVTFPLVLAACREKVEG